MEENEKMEWQEASIIRDAIMTVLEEKDVERFEAWMDDEDFSRFK